MPDGGVERRVGDVEQSGGCGGVGQVRAAADIDSASARSGRHRLLVLQSQSLEALVHVAARGLLGRAHNRRDLGVRRVGHVSQRDRGSLLGRKLPDLAHSVPSGRIRRRRRGPLRQLGDGQRGARARERTWSIALRWAIVKIQPRRFEASREPRIGPQRRQPRLLVAVVGVDAADDRDQEAVDVAAVGVEQRLKRWERSPADRTCARPRFREMAARVALSACPIACVRYTNNLWHAQSGRAQSASGWSTCR